MHRALIIFAVWLALISPAGAVSTEFSITPANLKADPYTFSVSTNAVLGGVAFHVTITNLQSDIFSGSNAEVDKVVHKKIATGEEHFIGKATPVIPVALKKENRVWVADFTVPQDSLKNSDVCFVFSVPVHTTINGKTQWMPAVEFYELKLSDFVKKAASDSTS